MKIRKDKCTICGLVLKSAKAMKQHLTTFHGGTSDNPDAETTIITNIQCTLCNSTETLESIENHLKNVHSVHDSNWEAYLVKSECLISD